MNAVRHMCDRLGGAGARPVAFRTCLLAVLLWGLTGGCARYQFRILEPPELAATVTTRNPVGFALGPLDYVLQTSEGRLIMTVTNPDERPIHFLGERSFVVDPEGQSRPLRGQVIAPHSFMKLILPPMRQVYRASPAIGIGIGVSAHRYYGRPWYDPWYPDPWHDPWPAYLVVRGDDEAYYWSWRGESTIRLRLTFECDGQSIVHDFTVRREKQR